MTETEVHDVVADLSSFIEASPSPYHAVATCESRLLAAGWRRLEAAERWGAEDAAGPAFVVRGGAIVAWAASERPPSTPLRIIGAHTDSPGLRLRPHHDGGGAGWRTTAVEVYGGALWNSWLDRDLRVAGRLAVSGPDGTVRSVLTDSVRGVARVPQLAIHLDREVNSAGLRLDPQRDLDPVWGLGGGRAGAALEVLAGFAGVDPGHVRALDVGFVDAQGPARIGSDQELLAAGRLDDLVCVWAGLRSLLHARHPDAAAVPVLACWDHEEVGSQTATGAAGGWLAGVLERRVVALGGSRDDLLRSLTDSSLLSADVAHAAHPSRPDRHDPRHLVLAGGGPAVKHNSNARYATDAPGAAAFVVACERAGVTLQHYSHRNDLACGSTIGPIVAAGLAVDTVDVGPPILSMHSARELVAVDDVVSFGRALESWTST